MNKYFYSHIIEIDSLHVALSQLSLSDKEREKLLTIVDTSLNHAILDAILSELSEKDKKLFTEHMQSNDDEKIWKFLGSKIDHIEDKIKKTAEDLKEQLHKDIKGIKK